MLMHLYYSKLLVLTRIVERRTCCMRSNGNVPLIVLTMTCRLECSCLVDLSL